MPEKDFIDHREEERRGSYIHERLAKLEASLALGERLVKLETQLTQALADFKSERDARLASSVSLDAKLENIDKRIRSMERNWYLAVGVVIAVDYLFRMLII